MSSFQKKRSSRFSAQVDLLRATWKECGEVEQVVGVLPEIIVIDSLKRPVHFPYIVSLKEEYTELADREKANHPSPTTTLYATIENREPLDVKGLQLKGAMKTVHFSCAVMRLVNSLKNLTELKLIDCSLVAESVYMLSASLKDSAVTHLYLDENIIQDENYHVILKDNLRLLHLSLRMCRITDVGAKKLAEELKYRHPSRHFLKSLNLNGNLIGDEGMSEIAKALRWNRNLVALNVAGNCIRDEGGIALAAVLTPFELSEEEMRLRGERMCERLLKIKDFIDSQSKLQSPATRAEDKKMSSGAASTGKKGLAKVSRETTPVAPAPFKGTYNDALTFYYDTERKATDEIPEDTNPLITDVKELEKGKYGSRGNSSLWHVNVSYNRLTVDSLQYFMNAAKYQLENVGEFDKGLARFEFDGNYFEENEPVIEELRKIFTPFKSKISIRETPRDFDERSLEAE